MYRKVLGQDDKIRKIGTVDSPGLAYTDTNLVAGETHRYRIKSNDNPPKSSYSQVVVPQGEPEPTPEPTPEPPAGAYARTHSGAYARTHS